MLPPMLILKGEPNGQIANREFVTDLDYSHYASQKKVWMDGWMDESMMNK